ncbi:MAG: hypothetical protein SFZ23_11790 [Planctomycetota bacterium]|nr:hypothetical protein [Planctomycetota bacterium]
MSAIAASKANLQDALKKLRMRLEHLHRDWDDQARVTFEKDFLDPIEPAMLTAIKGIDHASEIVARVRFDCEDRHEA